ncbi:MAG: hypothetical protein D6780_07395, partial [Candidatus Dadabacteria bacterium]
IINKAREKVYMPSNITETVSVVASKASPPVNNATQEQSTKPQPTYAQISQASAGEKKTPAAYESKPRAVELPKKVEAPFEPQKNEEVEENVNKDKNASKLPQKKSKIDLKA